ncbi:8-oxoguanine deaminase [Cryptosporangium phraense]|uniref:8-oxoguanine deaminase n=1 Tax=Cryptosporangium phraense TaxID=2593070 RepID=A0A545AQN1_9ACTN|nr:8-oxoguanine deaminase [Cryptosporangium phraense]TQS43551.1 8-oxoguanine deaminase [Cryptosporangium phraense]
MVTTVLDGCAIATVDGSETFYSSGHVVITDGVIRAVGPGAAPSFGDAVVVDASGCLATPGLVNTHHHLYQWATRAVSVDDGLFDWLTTLYPVWAGIDADVVEAAARSGLARLALTGCTTSTDHHYVFPASGGDVLGATVLAAQDVGLRFHPTRGSMDLGESAGGLPPDSVVESLDAILAAVGDAVAQWHDPSPGSLLRIAAAPCSPFSVTRDLMRESAAQARSLGIRLHTHLAETLDEDEFCRKQFGMTPVEYLASVDWLGSDVWLAHGVHLSDADASVLGAAGTGVAHCPSSNARLGSGIAPVPALLGAGVPVGLGVDGAASQENGGMSDELRAAVFAARLRYGMPGLRAREVLRVATMGGARCLGREAEIGSLEVGKRADVALWRVDGPFHADIVDPVDALVYASPPPLARLYVEGRPIVIEDELQTVDVESAGRDLRHAARALATRASA